MEYPAFSIAPPSTLRALAEHLRLTGSNLTMEQAIALAISEWRACHELPERAQKSALHGYQWKTLFLPDATELRMIHGDNSHYARVVGDHIIYQGRKVSPREMTLAISTSVRNAWRELWIRFPGERGWKRAQACRIEQQESQQQPQLSPAASMAAAAEAMAAALKTALMLVEQSGTCATQQIERRLAPLRRANDRLHDDVSFD